MSKKLGLVTVHGMGETDHNYFLGLKNSIENQLGKDIFNQVHLEPIVYQDIMQKNEDRVWQNMQTKSLAWKELRKFMLFGFADAATLEHKPEKPGSIYHKIQQKIVHCLQNTRKELGNQDRDIIIVAQSLGGQVLSNYIWDFQKDTGIWASGNSDSPDYQATEEGFLKLQSLRYLFTTGCNIPMFVAGFNNIQAIQKPNHNFKWFNYYDKDDVLGWPLKPLSESYNAVIEADVKINSGGLLDQWNPRSHNGYWTDKDFVKPLCNTIEDLLK